MKNNKIHRIICIDYILHIELLVLNRQISSEGSSYQQILVSIKTYGDSTTRIYTDMRKCIARKDNHCSDYLRQEFSDALKVSLVAAQCTERVYLYERA